MEYRIIYHQGETVTLKTKGIAGKVSLTPENLHVQGETTFDILFADISVVEIMWLHKSMRMIKVVHSKGTLFLSVIRVNILGYFVVVNTVQHSTLFRMLRRKIGGTDISAENHVVKTQDFHLPQHQYRAFLTQSIFRRMRNFVIISVAFFLMVGMMSGGNIKILVSWWPFFAGLGAWFLWMFWIVPRVMSKSELNIQSCWPGHFVFGKKCLSYQDAEGGTTQWRWEEFREVSIRRDTLILKEDEFCALIIPFAVFEHENDIDTVKMLIKSIKSGNEGEEGGEKE